MYSDRVMDHFLNPRNGGRRTGLDVRGVAGDPNSGPFMIVYLRLDGASIGDASFETYGCPAAIAAGSMLTEYVKGKNTEELGPLNGDFLLSLMGGLPLGKEHCAHIAASALSDALKGRAGLRKP